MRSSLKQEESARKDSPSEERIHSSAASARPSLSSGDHDRASSEICSEKIKPKVDTQSRDRTPRSKANAPANQVKASSPSTNGQQFLDVSGCRCRQSGCGIRR